MQIEYGYDITLALAQPTPVHSLLEARGTRRAMRERKGVCRDFAHLAIAFCRALNIPARYINGYLGDIGVPAHPAPMDFSAWLEVYLDGG